jgi:putative DNA primase/helicase
MNKEKTGNKDGGIDIAGKWKTVIQTTGKPPLTKGQSTNTGI